MARATFVTHAAESWKRRHGPPALAHALPATGTGRAQLRECPDCGLFQTVPPLPPATVARCPRCEAVLRRARRDPTGVTLACAAAGLGLFMIAVREPFLDLTLRGFGRETLLTSPPLALRGQGMWELGLVVLVTTMLAPLARLLATVWVLGCLRLQHPPRGLATVFRWVETLRPWSMVEVFLLGVFVAYTRLTALATVHVGLALYALLGLMLAMVAADAALDPEAVWEALDEGHAAARAAPAPGEPAIGCACCGLVSRRPAADAPSPACPRCGARLRARKADSMQRTWALLAAAALLYVPANLLPVMTVVSFGRGAPNTIISGVEELVRSGLWPLALLVFFASITVPVLKLLGLGFMLIQTHRRSGHHLRQRTRLYRVVEAIGRWSMIDVFMVSILTAIVRMGLLASVDPGPGVIAFCGVVILTMLARDQLRPAADVGRGRMNDAPSEAPRDAAPAAHVQPRRTVHWVWLIPIVVAAVGAYPPRLRGDLARGPHDRGRLQQRRRADGGADQGEAQGGSNSAPCAASTSAAT